MTQEARGIMRMMSFRNNIYVKVVTIAVMTLLLLIPTSMIEDLILEREQRQDEAVQEVSAKWAGTQTVSGPFLSIPFHRNTNTTTGKDTSEVYSSVTEHLHIMPSLLRIRGTTNPRILKRGIYEVVVYESRLELSGSFKPLDLEAMGISVKNLRLDEARLVIGIDDMRGIEKPVVLTWDEKAIAFNPGVASNDLVNSGIDVPVSIGASDTVAHDFRCSLDLKGSQSLYFIPVGKETDVTIASEWADPCFNGAFLPDRREVSDKGFTATWNILNLNRNYPQAWFNSSHSIRESAFGIDLRLPVDSYQKSHRSIRYAILFIAFTFIAFFFIEILKGMNVHPIQYLLVSFALITFFTLHLSISEHIGFDGAYAVSALATVLLVAAYVRTALGSGTVSLILSGVLSLVYVFVFVTIQLQDFALLMGSIGLFMILAAVMYLSRKIDWYHIRQDR